MKKQLIISSRIFVILLLLTTGYFLSSIEVEQISVYGELENIDVNELNSTLTKWKKTSWVSLDEEAMIKDISSMLWVDKVEIKKDELGQVKIKITEHKPVFRWKNKKLLTVDGFAFKVGNRTWKKYQNLKPLMISELNLDMVSDIYNTLIVVEKSPLGPLKKIEVSNWGTIQFYLQKYSLVSDVRNFKKRVDRFIAWENHFAKDLLSNVNKIDLRYNSGFSMINN